MREPSGPFAKGRRFGTQNALPEGQLLPSARQELHLGHIPAVKLYCGCSDFLRSTMPAG
jgi:hypothetical protein